MTHRQIIYGTVLLMLLICISAKTVLYVSESAFFSEIMVAELANALFKGLRYDLAAIAILLFLPTFLILVPGQNLLARTVQAIGIVGYVVGAALLLILSIAGLLFFAFFHRHLSYEINSVFTDVELVGPILMQLDQWILLLILATVVIIGLICIKLVRSFQPPRYGLTGYLTAVICVITLTVLATETYSNRPLRISDAYAENKPRTGHITLNPAYPALRSLLSRGSREWGSFLAQETIIRKQAEHILNELPPLQHIRANAFSNAPNKRNVVLVMLESWTPQFIGAFGSTESVTPNFDQIAKKGRRFQNFYASGIYSMNGLQSILTGIPSLPQHPPMSWGGVELLDILGLGEMLKRSGYESHFVLAAHRKSFGLDRLARRTGFDHYSGSQDFSLPNDLAEHPNQPIMGWDLPMYQYALRTLGNTNQPFMGLLYTGITHMPFIEVPEAQRLRPHGPKNLNGYINTLHRADWALGEFWKEAQKKPWHNNTIYIFVSDHVIAKIHADKSIVGQYRIPMVILGPGIGAGDDYRITSQVDIWATIADISQYPDPVPGMGVSLLGNESHQGVLATNGDVAYWLSKDEPLAMRPGNLATTESNDDVSPRHEALFVQAVRHVYTTLQANAWLGLNRDVEEAKLLLH